MVKNEHEPTGITDTKANMSTRSANIPYNGITGTSTVQSMYSHPILIDTIVKEDSIELVYKATSMITYTIYPPPPPHIRIWKDIYRCVDGKLKKDETVEGQYVSAQEETYRF